jgi:hypothetical protein
MAKTKEKTFLEYVESALASVLPSNVSSYERMKGRPALETSTKKLGNGAPTPRPNALVKASSGNTEVGRPNTSVVADRPMRNVTPKASGAGMASMASTGARLLNPVTALLSTTTTANKGAELLDPIFTENLRDRMEVENAKRVMATSAPSESRYRESAGNQRGSMDRQMVAKPSEPQYRESTGNQRGSMDRQMVASDTAPPKAIVVSEPKSGKPMAGDMTPEGLFAVVHGGPFNPKSNMDRKKMAVITELRSREGAASMTPNKFALTIYRTTK